jgi:rare lipoprotein A
MLRSILLSASVALLPFVGAPGAQAAACGNASHYGAGDGFHGRIAADGSRFSAHALTAASPSLPFGTYVRVVNQSNGKGVTVRITDRGPFVGGRILDLSSGAFSRIASPSQGIASVCWRRV